MMDRINPRSRLIRSRKAEKFYARQLRKIAGHVGDLINAMWQPDDPTAANWIGDALERYARLLEPWARAVGQNMLAEVDARDRSAWRSIAAEMSALRRRELTETNMGALTQARLAEQVRLITSLPRDAAERVHKLTLEGLLQGTRASEIAKEIARSGEVTASRANLIARTEVSRTGSEFTRARAESAGSEGYIWRDSGDHDVRHSHHKMDGQFVRWDRPPTIDGMTGHAGCFPNCRCWPDPVFPDF